LVRHRILRCRPSGGPTQDSTIGLAQDQRQARRDMDERRVTGLDTVVAYIGLDWADERHSVHLQTAEGAVEHRELEQKPAVLHEWIARLQQRFSGGKIAVALEQRRQFVRTP